MAASTHTDSAQQTVLDDLLTLADLAGIKGPGSSIKLAIELIMLGTPPQEVHVLLRDILASKNRSKRISSKHSSRRANTSADAAQEKPTPQS